MLLQHLKVILLICGMLVNHEDVRVEFGDNEAQVKLTDDLHLFEHVFTIRMKEKIMSCCGNDTTSSVSSSYRSKFPPDLLLELFLCTLVFTGVDFGPEASIPQILTVPLLLQVL